MRTSDNPPILTRSDWSLIVIGLLGRTWDNDALGQANAKQAKEIAEKIMKVIK